MLASNKAPRKTMSSSQDIPMTQLPIFWLSYRRASAMMWQSFGSGPPPEGVKQFVPPIRRNKSHSSTGQSPSTRSSTDVGHGLADIDYAGFDSTEVRAGSILHLDVLVLADISLRKCDLADTDSIWILVSPQPE